jgi:cold shock CspA family protein
MYGKITSFTVEKGFGFIRGEDGKDYFFHVKDFAGERPNAFADGLPIIFDPIPTPKGYRAQDCKLLEAQSLCFEVPDSILITNLDHIKGWEVIEACDWSVESGWHSDKEAAFDEFKKRIQILRANGVVQFKYIKGTDSENNYIFTTFKYTGRPVFVARVVVNGVLKKEDFHSINDRVRSLLDAHGDNKKKCLEIIKSNWRWTIFGIVFSTLFIVFCAVVLKEFFIIWAAVFVDVIILLRAWYVRLENTIQDFWVSSPSTFV